jgi:hypothetical protein
MNKRALITGFIYCLFIIAFKLFILLGGYTFTRFGFNYAHIISIFFIIPFFMIAIRGVREKEMNGAIGGRHALRISLTVLATAMVLLSIYNYVEFNWKFKELAIQYYNSPAYLDILKEAAKKVPDKVKETDFPTIISQQISGLSPGKSTTGKLFPLLLVGLSGAFASAMFMRKNAVK